MKYQNLGPYKTINQFVDYKLASLKNSETSFNALFDLMFSETNNIFYEYTFGFDIKKVTYGESKNHIISLSRHIASLNLKHNSVIAIYLDNDLSWLETFWAILRSGCRPLLLNMRLDDTSLIEAMEEMDCELVISKGKEFKIKTVLYDELDELKEVDTPKEFGEEIFFMSSGTTENVKICAYGASQLKAVLAQSEEIIKSNKLIKRHYNGELKLLTFLPFYHIFGFIAVYTWFSFYARTFVGLNDLSPQTIKTTINRHKVTHIFAVPLFWQKTYETALKEIKKRGDKTYKKFLKGMTISSKLGNSLFAKAFSKLAYKEIREGMFGDSISFLISGGSSISKDVLSFFNNIGYHLANGYGMTEIGITSVDLSNNYKNLVNGSIGKPLSKVEYKINENNELTVKGATLAKYIISNHEKVDRDETYFNTHDLMKIDKGRYYFLGRQDDLIVGSNGENLNPNIIEERVRLIDTPNLALVSDPKSKEAILLVEVNRYLSKDKVFNLEARIKDKIKENNYASLIKKVEFIKSSFIKGEEFKINRKRIAKEYFLDELEIYDLSKDYSLIENDEITNKVIDIVKDILSVPTVDTSKDLFLDYGANSLDYYAIVEAIYSEFEVNIINEDNKLSTVKDIIEFVRGNL